MARQSRTAFKEMWWILLTWCVFCAWVIAACAPYYLTRAEDSLEGEVEVAGRALELVWGLPAWVFWGIALPWAAATSFTILFASLWIRNDESAEDSHD